MATACKRHGAATSPDTSNTDRRSEPSNTFPHVLLAEDNECTLRVVEQLLKQCGYRGDILA
jgi:hypothetical protein